MVFVNVLTSAHLLPLVSAYQEGVNQDVCILTRLGHDPPALGGDLGPVHAVMAPWLDRVGFRFLPQLCPLLVFSYALEYGRVDLLRELMETNALCLRNQRWRLRIGTWTDCKREHRHLQQRYEGAYNVPFEHGCFAGPYGLQIFECGSRTSIFGHLHHLAVAACLGGHVNLLRFAMDDNVGACPTTLAAIALRSGRPSC